MGGSVKAVSIGGLPNKVFDTRFVHQPAADTFAKLRRKVPLRSPLSAGSKLNLGGKQTSIRYCFNGIPIFAHRAILVYINQ
jgi:hypothetical protein